MKAAGAYADKNPRTLRRWVQAGYLTGYRSGPRTILVDLDDLDRLLWQQIPAPSDGGAA